MTALRTASTFFLLTSTFLALTSCSHTPPQIGDARGPASVHPNDVVVIGGDAGSFTPSPASAPPVNDPETYDVIVVGGGLAGLSSAVYLTDAKKKVLLLEKEDHLGGLAAWSDRGLKMRTRVGRGAAYWTDAYEEEGKILEHIGLGDFMKANPIPEPIDSYYVRGKYYAGIWDEKTVKELPASFALYKFVLERSDKLGKIPNQPFEEFEKFGGTMELDRLTAREWIERMPERLEAAGSEFTKESNELRKTALGLLARFHEELKAGKLAGATGMQDVVDLMDLYCRSALGTTSDHVSAMAFANFYISEIVTRYTSSQGTGLAADKMAKILAERPKLFHGLKDAGVYKVTPLFDGGNVKGPVDVFYNRAGQAHVAHARYVVFSAQLKAAPQLIEGFAERSTKQTELINSLGYSHYSVHTVEVEGHPYRAAYDTWLHASDYSEDDPTDVILGLWMDPHLRGYEGYRNFKKNPDGDGILTIYHPLPQKWLATQYSDDDAKRLASGALDRVESLFSRLPPSLYRGPLKVKKVETSRWPFSVHIAEPGHYIEKAKVLRQPFGPIFFANNNIGTPAFEEALFRGHCAADNILKRMNPRLKLEKWSRCPIDR